MVARPRAEVRRLVVKSVDALAADLLASSTAWQVHSVFAQALNLVSEAGTLLGVVCRPAGNGPATLVVAPAEQGDMEPWSGAVTPGMPTQISRERISITKVLTLDCTTAVCWAPPALQVTLPAAMIRARVLEAVSLAQTVAPDGGFAPLLSAASGQGASGAGADLPSSGGLAVTQAQGALQHLGAAIRAADWGASHLAARALSGLGPGLTPAGDDVLVGLALGFRATSGGMPAPLADALGRAVCGRTTDLAAARVHHALDGHPDEAVSDLLIALLTDGGHSLNETVRRVVDYGHSSGVDTLVGLVLGIRLGLERLPPLDHQGQVGAH